jgi:hypothetical protein
MNKAGALALVLAGALSSAAVAQELPQSVEPAPAVAEPVAAPAPAVTAPPAAGQSRVAAGTIVSIEVGERLNSKIHVRGYRFPIRLAEPIESADGVLIPAGAEGVGEVISASKAGMMGKAGELLLAARYLTYNGQQIPLRTFRLGDAGTDNTTTVVMVGMVVPFAFVIKGGDIEIPAGTRANAKLAADVSLPIVTETAQPAAPVETPASSILTNQEPAS